MYERSCSNRTETETIFRTNEKSKMYANGQKKNLRLKFSSKRKPTYRKYIQQCNQKGTYSGVNKTTLYLETQIWKCSRPMRALTETAFWRPAECQGQTGGLVDVRKQHTLNRQNNRIKP